MKTTKALTSYFSPVLITLLLVTTISTITRLLLFFRSAAVVDFSISQVTGIFLIGLPYDLLVAGFFSLPVVLHLWWLNETSYRAEWKWLMPAGYLVIISILVFTRLVPAEFNKDLRLVIIGYFCCRLLIFLLLSAAGGSFRQSWRKYVLVIDIFLLCFIAGFNALGEWFFWEEFSTRYNFIAVDYLVYTNEVIGNIRQSYPVGWIATGIFLLSLLITLIFRNSLSRSVQVKVPFLFRSIAALVYVAVIGGGYLLADHDWRKFSDNEYANELAGNGIYEFGKAFWNNELDYYRFYRTMPDKEAFTLVRKELSTPYSKFLSDDVFNIEREINYGRQEKKMNVVLVSVESLSAGYMKAFGSTSGITPWLDSLATQSMFFTNLYASGTRTVRGLEALSLSIPPTPGQSIVKRPGNERLFSLGSVFRSKGYTTQYIYGGDSYFDNMEYFFSNNSYDVIDRDKIPAKDIHYANVWGVADEDLFSHALRVLDSNYTAGKPFFSHIMTVSNHRPFTYPDGRIDIPSANQSREGGVKYTDYCIGKFLADAAMKPWFRNTIFVIVADHCAGSAGSVELPVTGYHIPMLIYSPGNIQPREISTVCAQIDIAPTILGILNFRYKSKFFGRDIFNVSPGKERAFISTYQGLGFIKSDRVVIQSPMKKIQAYVPDFVTGKSTPVLVNDTLVKQAIAWYQCASWLIRNKKYNSAMAQ